MKKHLKLYVKNKNGVNQYPQINMISTLLKDQDVILHIVFENEKYDDTYRISLQEKLPEHHVLNLRYNPEICIYAAMHTQKLMPILKDVWACAIDFKEEGTRLMKMMGERYNINPFDGKELFGLKRKSQGNTPKQRGKVDENWDYYFHGAECRFDNKQTKQVIELVITYVPEFGALDSWFFLNYIKTTPKYKVLADFFCQENQKYGFDQKSLSKALTLMEDLGYLKRIDEKWNRGVVAKSMHGTN